MTCYSRFNNVTFILFQFWHTFILYLTEIISVPIWKGKDTSMLNARSFMHTKNASTFIYASFLTWNDTRFSNLMSLISVLLGTYGWKEYKRYKVLRHLIILVCNVYLINFSWQQNRYRYFTAHRYNLYISVIQAPLFYVYLLALVFLTLSSQGCLGEIFLIPSLCFWQIL